jgi:hypothetical protein
MRSLVLVCGSLLDVESCERTESILPIVDLRGKLSRRPNVNLIFFLSAFLICSKSFTRHVVSAILSSLERIDLHDHSIKPGLVVTDFDGIL